MLYGGTVSEPDEAKDLALLNAAISHGEQDLRQAAEEAGPFL